MWVSLHVVLPRVKISSQSEFGKASQCRLTEAVRILVPFDLWTSYLARILFVQEYGSLFCEYPSSTRIFNGLQYSFQVWQGFINVSESFFVQGFLIHPTYNKERRFQK
jgi:hypothetical protein